jgi:hypothetical protein
MAAITSQENRSDNLIRKLLCLVVRLGNAFKLLQTLEGVDLLEQPTVVKYSALIPVSILRSPVVSSFA